MKLAISIDDTTTIQIGDTGMKANLNTHGVVADVDVSWVEMQYAYDRMRGLIPSKVAPPGENDVNQNDSPMLDLRQSASGV